MVTKIFRTVHTCTCVSSVSGWATFLSSFSIQHQQSIGVIIHMQTVGKSKAISLTLHFPGRCFFSVSIVSKELLCKAKGKGITRYNQYCISYWQQLCLRPFPPMTMND